MTDQEQGGTPLGEMQESPEVGSEFASEPRESAQEGDFQIDDLKLQMLRDRLRSEQNLGAGVGAGAVAALLGAVLWAVLTVVTGYQIGWMAVGIGFLVGFAVRYFGKGLDTSFAVFGAVLSLAGCVLGKVLSVYGFASKELGIPLTEVLGRIEPGVLFQILVDTFSPIDLLFYGIAVYEGWKLSRRQLTQEELERLLGETG